MKRMRLLSVVLLVTLALAACSAPAASPTAAPQPTTPPDLLSDILKRGYLLVSTDANYEPQSFLKPDGKRTEGTKCPGDALTAGEIQGFDIDTAVELGKRLGVETCFATPSWDTITAGNWGDKWDISVGSMTITTARQKVLYFTTPYYYTPAQIAAQKDAGLTKLEDLNGKAICVGTSTTYESWLNGDMVGLGLPETSIYAQAPTGLTVVPLETDQECAQAIASGRKDFIAYLTSATVVDSNIKAGVPVVKVGLPVYSEDLAVAIDKAHKLDATSLVSKLDEAVKAMHADGSLSKSSNQWFGADLTLAPK